MTKARWNTILSTNKMAYDYNILYCFEFLKLHRRQGAVFLNCRKYVYRQRDVI